MKQNRIISLLLILAIALTLSVVVSADNPASLRLGDVNGNGVIDPGDALEILQYSVEKIDAFTAEKSAAASDPTPIASDPTVDTSEPATSETVSPYGFIEEPIERGALFRSLEEFEAWFASDQVEERVTPERLAFWRGDETIRYLKPVGLINTEDL